MAFEKTKQELRDTLAIPARQATIIACIALGVAIIALIVVMAKGK